MAASSNDSFGLKIATAFSIALTVVLLISVYFLNSNYNAEFEKRVKAEGDARKANDQVRESTNAYNEMRTALGYVAIEDVEAVKAQMKKDQEQVKGEIQTISTEVTSMVNEFQKKMESKGADASQFETLKSRGRELTDRFLTDPDQSYKAQVSRLKDLTSNQAKLSTIVALNYIDLRRDLEIANETNDKAKKSVEAGLATARTELDETIKKDEESRSKLVADNREKADALAALDSKMNDTVNKNRTDSEKREKEMADLNSVLRDIRDQQARKENVMIKPGGRITFVDYGAGTVRVNVNRSQGVRPLMRFTIFDKNASGLSSDKPKGAVELIKVGDPQRGENDSLARIVNTFEAADPIQYNDYIFSVGWSYDHPQRFDLIGKIDVNRDGRDDRADLIRMIEAAGGVIEYDLPPPNVDRGPGQAAVARAYARLGEPVPPAVGRSSGKITGLSYGYITDTRPSLVVFQKKAADPTKEDTAFLTEESQATKEARDNSVRPLPLEKVLNMLGYDYSAPIEGRREAFDKPGMQELLKPRPTGPGVPSGVQKKNSGSPR